MVSSKGAAMAQNSMRCAAIKVQHPQYFGPDFGISQLSINRPSTDFQHNDGRLIAFHVIYGRRFSVKYF